MVEVGLPYGYKHEGAWRRSVWLRPWNGHDEAALTGEGAAEYPAARTTLLLSRCVHPDRESGPASAKFVRSLTAGDRDALLLHLRRITVGRRIEALVNCERCHEAMELDVEIESLIGPAGRYSAGWHELILEREGGPCTIRFRVPDGGDMEDAAALALRDPAAAERLVLERCIEGPALEELSPEVIQCVGEAMKERDPQAEMLLEGTCFRCGEPFTLAFDAARYVFREMEQAQPALERDVHLLALYYHWSANDILGMTPVRRGRYVQRLLDSLSERRRA
jgi:hypothetical protein